MTVASLLNSGADIETRDGKVCYRHTNVMCQITVCCIILKTVS